MKSEDVFWLNVVISSARSRPDKAISVKSITTYPAVAPPPPPLSALEGKRTISKTIPFDCKDMCAFKQLSGQKSTVKVHHEVKMPKLDWEIHYKASILHWLSKTNGSELHGQAVEGCGSFNAQSSEKWTGQIRYLTRPEASAQMFLLALHSSSASPPCDVPGWMVEDSEWPGRNGQRSELLLGPQGRSLNAERAASRVYIKHRVSGPENGLNGRIFPTGWHSGDS